MALALALDLALALAMANCFQELLLPARQNVFLQSRSVEGNTVQQACPPLHA